MPQIPPAANNAQTARFKFQIIALLLVCCFSFTTRAQQSRAGSKLTPKTQNFTAPTARTPRERRAAAYAKFLEGQRLLIDLRRDGATPENIRAVQTAFQRAVELDPTLAEAHTALADIALYLLEDVDQAEREAMMATKIDRNNIGAHRLLARLYTLKSDLSGKTVNRENVERAIMEWREVARLNETDAESWALLGELYDATGRAREAIAAFTKWTATPQPLDQRFYQAVTQGRELSSAAAFARLSEAQLKDGRAVDALASMRRAVAIEPESREYQESLVILLRSQNKGEEALEAARAARKRFPRESSFARLEIATLVDLRRFDEAAALVCARIRGRASDYLEYRLLWSIYLEAGKTAEAVEAARKELELAPAERNELVTQALLDLATAQERAGDFNGAETSLRRILTNEPTNATALNNLGYFLVERNEHLAEALSMIERAVQIEPTNASFLDSLGWAHFKLGHLAEAERFLNEAIKRNPQSPVYQDHLGDVLSKSGRTELARAAWRKALELTTKPGDAERLKAKLGGDAKR
jgi:Flp pilus assembly protein TadD